VGTLSHITAFLGALAAGFGTLPTVVHMVGMFFALSRTGFTDMGAELAHVSRMWATTGHERNSRVADFGAVPVESDAVYHHLNILLTKAGFGAGVTGNSASLAGFYAGLVLWGS
jgi:hypothetical protein